MFCRCVFFFSAVQDLAADLGALAAQVLSRTAEILQHNWRSFVRQPHSTQAGRAGAVAAALAGMAARQGGELGASAFHGQAAEAAARQAEAGTQE
eukprot:scaffold201361_cov49-Prasinocladus_malaysianus.AAC.7